MTPDIFLSIASDSDCADVLGDNPLRFWPFAAAPQNPVKPYATWQVIYGSPENYLDRAPDIDSIGVQIDCWGDTISSVRSAAKSIRGAIEPVAHVVAFNGESREPDTKLYRVSFSVDFWQTRGYENGS